MTDAPWLSDGFFDAVVALGLRRGSPPHVFLSVWCVESGLRPSAINQTTGARGLNQMMPATLASMGAPQDFERLPGEEQLPWIEHLIATRERLNGGPFQSAARYYHANFFPRTMARGKNLQTVVVARDAEDDDERGAYAANSGLDANRDGVITLADLAAVIERIAVRFVGAFGRLSEAMVRAHAQMLAPRSKPPKRSPWIAVFALGLGTAMLVAHKLKPRGSE